MSVRVRAAGIRTSVPIAALERAGHLVLSQERALNTTVSVALVSAARIAAMNATHLGVRRPTDVIAFRLQARARAPVTGDVYVSPSVARANARRFRVSPREELVRCVVHGILHVLGYDHPEGEARTDSTMWRRQEAIVRRATGRR